MRPVVSVPVVPPQQSQVRFNSPVTSSSPSFGAHSPPADTESFYDSFPVTPPPDTNVQSPFQRPFYEDWQIQTQAVQFTGMGLTNTDACVNPLDVNPSQLDYCESESGKGDFGLPQSQFGFENGYPTSQCDLEPEPPVDFHLGQMADANELSMVAKEEAQVSTHYPLPPNLSGQHRDGNGSDDDLPLPASKRRKGYEDSDYKPNKKHTTSRVTPGRRSPKQRRVSTSTAANSASLSSPEVQQQQQNQPTRALPATIGGAKGVFACKDCPQQFKDRTGLQNHSKKQHERPFVCVFHFAGCQSVFGSKNEWKRHVTSQHLLLHYWLCREGACAKTVNGPPAASCSAASGRARQSTTASAAAAPAYSSLPNGAIFNRKDLYTQHLRRMHVPPQLKRQLKQQQSGKKSSPSSNNNPEWEQRVRHLQEHAIQERCKLPEAMRCPAEGCGQEFTGPEAWDQRMEHVARHLEKAGQAREPPVVFGGPSDPTLVQWASRGDVSIIRRKTVKGQEQQWELNDPLKRKVGGGPSIGVIGGGPAAKSIVVAGTPEPEGEDVPEDDDGVKVMSEIVVSEDGGDDHDDGMVDAEGEEDDEY